METVSVVPIFPGEIAYFLVDVGVAHFDVTEEDRGESDRRRTPESRNIPSHKSCSVVLLVIRTLTLTAAIIFLLLHGRLYTHASGSRNCTIEIAER